MILSNVSIQKAIDKGWLIIEPEPLPRRKIADAECPYQTSSVDLRLGPEIAFFKKEALAFNIDLRRGGFATMFGPHSESLTCLCESALHAVPFAPVRQVVPVFAELLALVVDAHFADAHFGLDLGDGSDFEEAAGLREGVTR